VAEKLTMHVKHVKLGIDRPGQLDICKSQATEVRSG
jgi:hypothetical protein